MVDRKPKLIAAGAVLTAGLSMAMLFRRTETPSALPPAVDARLSATITPVAPAPGAVLMLPMVAAPPTALDGQLSPLATVPATNASLTTSVGILTAESRLSPPIASPVSGVADAVALPLGTTPLAPAADALGGRPVYDTQDIAGGPIDSAASAYQIHVVHEGDSLERIAERYLGDGGRSLELFDLNRDLLDNPHLLKIGAELKIPVGASTADN